MTSFSDEYQSTTFFGLTPGQKKKAAIAGMFDNIAWRYDLLNHLLSFGIDRRWRKKAIGLLKNKSCRYILDVATGTGDFAIRASKLCPQKITGIDISEKMLEIGRKKISKKGLEKIITLHSGEAEKLNFDDNSFDAVIVAFGVRNFENLSAGLNEIFRVLCCDGTVVILEFSRPYAFPLKQLYRLYFNTILPAIGKILSKNRSAYSYLPESVFRFPEGKEFTNLLKDTGFTDTVLLRLSGGIASVYRGTKKYPKISD